jgi:predicted transcriptional regulator
VSDQSRRASGELEAEVLATLWAADGPLTPGHVRERLGSELAYTTVLTILTRLHTKGAVTREPSGRGHAYIPAYDEAELASSRMHALLDRGSDREAVLARFVGDLSEDDERTLADLLRRAVHRRST